MAAIAPEGAPTEGNRHVGGQQTVAVAVSGGRDSIALLHSTVRCAADFGLQVLALHVNHGLMPQADQWQGDLRKRCAAWGRYGAPLRLICERIEEKPLAGDSVEAWARKVRYAALRRMALAAGCDTVLLAHHRRDQAETFLLQALRGGGVAGIAGMPTVAQRDGIHWLRPWLAQPRDAIEAYIRRHRLRFVDDASNTDPRWARNRLRQQVWPTLLEAFPQAEPVLGDAARWAGFAADCLNELADIDLARIAGPAGLILDRWAELSPARRRNALRAWLHRSTGQPAPAALVDRLVIEWPGPADRTTRGGRIWDWAADRIVSKAGLLMLMRGAADTSLSSPLDQQSIATTRLEITRTGCYPVPGWRGSLFVEPAATGGIALNDLACIELRSRQGGERFQAAPQRPPRSLKKQFQAAEVPAWERDGPLLYVEGRLVFVPGLGFDSRALSAEDKGATRVSLRWQSGHVCRAAEGASGAG